LSSSHHFQEGAGGQYFHQCSAIKKPYYPSTYPGTQVTGSMLLGEGINILCLSWCLFVSLTEYFFSFLDGSVVELLEGEDEEDGLPLLLVGEYLERSF
jgi:hypothetical protein